ncbi:MAG: undecaprenyl-diphosphate phosphatase [Magnetococcales bacterium]|nr:undecaprenyl-diphosphate phosphatase [Magnetococcales bacterium]MBF0419447.1 undecaprenyl-diphosphate phosphatase [Magnetococcales bacterium]
MSIIHIAILAIIQGAAELLPVSSSAHVIVSAKLLGLDPTSPEMTLLLVMLHTGTMFAVILYFWHSWRQSFFSSKEQFFHAAKGIAIATLLTGIVGLTLKTVIEKTILKTVPHAEIEMLFGNLGLISASLTGVGCLIIFAGYKSKNTEAQGSVTLGTREAAIIGIIQGLCLPFRGFSRSGATISTGLLLGLAKMEAEVFSFALAVVLTPPVVVREVMRLLKAHASNPNHQGIDLAPLFFPSMLGMVLSFIAGMLALKWLSSWLEKGRWSFFGYYCLGAALFVLILYKSGY